MQGRIIAVSLAVPRTIPHRGGVVRTGIYKEPVDGPITLDSNGAAGDLIADLRVHGGPDKAVYAYPSEHYAWWREQLPEFAGGWGFFGENLTTEGLSEETVWIGDRFTVGTAVLEAAQPRQPCFKFVYKIGTPRGSDLMVNSGRSGIYCRVVTAGAVRAGDVLQRIHEDPHGISIRQLNSLLTDKAPDRALLERIIRVPALPAKWRTRILERLPDGEPGVPPSPRLRRTGQPGP